jgi:hypothetical protein
LVDLTHKSLIRVTPVVLSMWPCNLTLDEEKSKHASLDQQNGFWHSRYAQFAEVCKGTAKAITLACCWLARSFDWSRWVAISNLPPILVLWVGLAKE